jgi:hypothetical protein
VEVSEGVGVGVGVEGIVRVVFVAVVGVCSLLDGSGVVGVGAGCDAGNRCYFQKVD